MDRMTPNTPEASVVHGQKHPMDGFVFFPVVAREAA